MRAVRITGEAKTRRALKEFGRAGPRAVAAALHEAGMEILNASLKEAPVDTAELRRSGYVAVPSTSAQRLTVEVGYTAKHAVRIHETNRTYRAPGTKWRYLADPFERLKGSVFRRVQARAAELVKSGGKIPTRHVTRRRTQGDSSLLASFRARHGGT